MNTWAWTYEWARRIGANPTGTPSEVSLLRSIAAARGATTTGYMNRTEALRSIAASYGKSSGTYNDRQSLLSIVDALGATPSGRNLGDLNEREALGAIVGAVSAFTPTDISGLQIWLKADALTKNDGDQVPSWTDSSGNGKNATQVVEAKRPIYKASIFNGKPVVRFDATNDGLITTLSLARPYTIFLVASQASSGLHRLIQGDAVNALLSIRRAANTVFLGADVVDAAYGANNTAAILCLSVSASATTTFHHNGTNIAIGSPASANWGVLALGAEGSGLGSAEPANGDIAELLAYNSFLSNTDRRNVEAHLSQKYAITVA